MEEVQGAIMAHGRVQKSFIWTRDSFAVAKKDLRHPRILTNSCHLDLRPSLQSLSLLSQLKNALFPRER